MYGGHHVTVLPGQADSTLTRCLQTIVDREAAAARLTSGECSNTPHCLQLNRVCRLHVIRRTHLCSPPWIVLTWLAHANMYSTDVTVTSWLVNQRIQLTHTRPMVERLWQMGTYH